jgi:nuclear pore complex protein Nup43
MAITGGAFPERPQIHRLPQSHYIDAVRWLPQLSAFDRFAVLALSSPSPALQIHSLDPQTLTLAPQSSWTPPSRVSSLQTSRTQTHQPLIAAGTVSGSLHLLFANAVDASMESELSVPEKDLHAGPVSCVDVMDGAAECVSVGEDGRVNLVSVSGSRLGVRRVFDSEGLVSYTAAKWASPAEFVTGGYGFGLQWWDQRRPGGAVSQFKANW